MNSENNNNANNDENKILLPPKTTNKKTLVLDLDETLVHSQFMTFSAPSDVIIKIEIENEVHDIHVMVRPGVKEFLEKMDKFFEIVIFTASVSKYADPLLDIIDKKGYCPFRLFREHCSLINTTFVKDLQRLGRDLKDIVIVDNSPLSYALHPENGLPILTWFEDKNDTELYQIMPVLEFLSYVPDVRDYVPKLVGSNNKIDYEKAREIINGYNGPRYISQDIENQNIKHNNDIEINVEIIPENEKNNVVLRNANKNNNEKIILNNNGKAQDKLNNLDMNNIIASVSRDSVKQNNNQIMINKNNSNNKIYNKKKLDNQAQDKNINKETKNINIELQNFINVKKLSNTNSHSVKKNFKPSITDKSFKTFKNKRISNSAGGNRLKNSLNNNPNTNSKSIILNSNNSSNKFKNQTPKITKSINLINNKNIHSTRSVKYPKKTKIYINNTTSYDNNNNSSNKLNNKISKSLTKNAFNTEKVSNKENIINNKNKKNNTLYKNFTSNSNNLSSQNSKQKIDNNLKSFKDNKKNSNEKGKKFNKKNESKKIKNNNFLKTGSIQQKMNNLSNSNNINTTSSLSFSSKYNNLNKLNINGIDYVRSNRENNQIKLTHIDNNFTNENKNKNYSINNRYEKASNSMSNNNQNKFENKSLNLKKKTSNNIGLLDKDNNKSQKKNLNNIYKPEAISLINGVKTTRPKSSSNTKFMVKTNISKEKPKNLKNPTKKLEINEILHRRGLAEKNNNIKKEIKK